MQPMIALPKLGWLCRLAGVARWQVVRRSGAKDAQIYMCDMWLGNTVRRTYHNYRRAFTTGVKHVSHCMQ